MPKTRQPRGARTLAQRWGWAFVAPWIAGFAVFTAWPVFYSLWLSFYQVKIKVGELETLFIGAANYTRAFTWDTSFVTTYLDTLSFVGLSVPMILVFSVVIAILLNQKLLFKGFFRAVFFLPFVIISGSVIAELVTNGSTNIGGFHEFVVYRYLETLPSLLSGPLLYVFDNIVLILWFSSVQVLIVLAGLQKIDHALYEAARIDGATAWQVFWKLTLPDLMPLVQINAVYTVVQLASFPEAPLNQLIRRRMFEAGITYSYAAALSWMFFLTALVLIGLFALLLRPKRDERRPS
ncbi:MAG: sugar ABC transporter permease [Spirochaetales bacterium]